MDNPTEQIKVDPALTPLPDLTDARMELMYDGLEIPSHAAVQAMIREIRRSRLALKGTE